MFHNTLIISHNLLKQLRLKTEIQELPYSETPEPEPNRLAIWHPDLHTTAFPSEPQGNMAETKKMREASKALRESITMKSDRPGVQEVSVLLLLKFNL